MKINDREALLFDLRILATNFYKIIEVNLDDNNYFDVMSDAVAVYNDVRVWAKKFVEVGVHGDDRKKFVDYFEGFGKDKIGEKLFYRRLINGEWRYVCMEIIPGEVYSDDSPIVLLVVRDVEDYLEEGIRQGIIKMNKY